MRCTDQELEIALDESLTAAEAGEILGRNRDSIWGVRSRNRLGKGVSTDAWTRREDNFIIDNPQMSARQLSEVLMRSLQTTRRRRTMLSKKHGFKVSRNYDPNHVGAGRRLLARTCPDCGLLLDARFFSPSAGNRRSQICTRCTGKRVKSSPSRRNRKSEDRSWANKLQAATTPAKNHRKPWTESEYEVLMDPDKSNFAKAIELGRSYIATADRVYKIGGTSKADWYLGDIQDGQWQIKFEETA